MTFEVVIMCIPRLLQSFIYQTLLWKRSYCIKMKRNVCLSIEEKKLVSF